MRHHAECCAVLLMLQKASEKSVFDDVVRDVSGCCQSIDLPWLDVELSLANIKQSCAQPDDRCEQSANTDQNDSLHVSTVNDTSQPTAAAAAAADYSHLYIYKKNTNTTASWSGKTNDYIALSSSSSDEDESGDQSVRVASSDDHAVTVSSAAVADRTAAASIRCAKFSRLYRSPNTGVQIANPNKKKNKKRS